MDNNLEEMKNDVQQTQSENIQQTVNNELKEEVRDRSKEILGKPTSQQVETLFLECRDVFWKKLQDYGSSWRILRPKSVTDQLFIKAGRIRNIEEIGDQKIDDDIRSEFQGIVNYGIIALIQLELNYSDYDDLRPEQAIEKYDKYYSIAISLLTNKNHDYSEAWRRMRVSSYTDFILVKLNRIKGIEDNHGKTLISEGIESNYLDIINYAMFGLIKLTEEAERNDAIAE